MKSFKMINQAFLKDILFKRKNYILSFVFTWIVYTVFLINSGYNIFYNDAWAYWDYGTKMFIGNHFSLLNYGDASRGVLFPFLNSILVLVSRYLNIDGLLFFKIFSAFITSFIFCFLFPETIYRLTEKAASIGNIMLFNAITLFFWGAYFNYPLSDFFTLFLIVFCFYLSLRPNILNSILFGICIALIINTRPIYIISALPLLGFYFIHLQKTSISYFKNFIFIFISFFITSLPQLIINVKIWNNYTLLQPTDSYYKGESLYLKQLRWGIEFEKYETSVGKCYPIPEVKYKSNIGSEIIRSFKNDSIKNYIEYTKTVSQNPGVFAIIYFKHIFNALDLPNRTPYLKSMKYNWGFHAVNYAVLFILMIFLFINIRKINRSYFLLFATLLLPVILVIPTAIEVRFFLPVFIIAYTVISYFGAEMIAHFKSIKRKQKLSLLIISFLIFITFCFYLSLETASNIEFQILC